MGQILPVSQMHREDCGRIAKTFFFLSQDGAPNLDDMCKTCGLLSAFRLVIPKQHYKKVMSEFCQLNFFLLVVSVVFYIFLQSNYFRKPYVFALCSLST